MDRKMYEVGIVTGFEAAHRLRGDFGPAQRLHGHTYRVEIAVQGDMLRDDDTLCDIALLQEAAGELMAELHYRTLDDLPAFSATNSTAEAVARHLFDHIAPRLAGAGVDALTVRVWESPSAWAAYSGPLPERSEP
jgi:6-pyruvoyltetrahydropterin/6-carboxytetrahydropterin synthase